MIKKILGVAALSSILAHYAAGAWAQEQSEFTPTQKTLSQYLQEGFQVKAAPRDNLFVLQKDTVMVICSIKVGQNFVRTGQCSETSAKPWLQ